MTQPPEPAQAPPPRPINRAADGWTLRDNTGVIVRAPAKEGSTTVITGSANGIGNRIVVDNGGTPGVTIIQNVRNGVGNSVIVTPKGPVIDLSEKARLAPTVEYKGRATKFWSRKVFSETMDCNLYWCPKTQWWFKYDNKDDVYRPLAGYYDPRTEKK
jgi:hypothetical protein